MRYLIILLLCTFCIDGYCQTSSIRRNSYAERYYYVDSLEKFLNGHMRGKEKDTVNILSEKANEAGDIELAGKLKLLAWHYMMHGNGSINDTIAKNIEAFIAYAADNHLPHLEADARQLIGDYYWNHSTNISAALENFIAAYNIYRSFNPDDFPPKQGYLYALCGTYYHYEDFDNAIPLLHEAMTTKGDKKGNMYYTINNTIGLCYRKMKQYDSALLYFNKVYDSASKAPRHREWESIAGGNIGITYFYQGRYDDAIPLLEKDIDTSLASHQIKNAATSMTIRAAIYYYKKDYNNAEKLLLKAINTCESKPFWPYYPIAEQMYTWLYKVYAAKNDMRHAYLYADSALTAKDSANVFYNSLNLTKANEKINLVQQNLDAEKLKARIKTDQLEIGKRRIETVFFFIGILILMAVVLFIARERKRSESLLLNILPEKIAERLKKREHPIADYFENASILFIDMAGFTLFSDGKDPKEVVNMLNNIFTHFDSLADKYGLEKIKTIGDCYMAVSGVPEPNPHHAEAAAKMAVEIKAEMSSYKADDHTPLVFRIGLDCGPVVAGVIGKRKFIYDLWGDAVNTASRMETTGIPGEIHCSDRFKKQIEDKYQFTSRGTIEIKGKGMMETWLIR